jgi:uracil-DNA glycosylase
MKPYIIGPNNPLSARPRAARVPWPGRCAGWRLVQMARAVDPTFDETEYLDSFVLRNLWGGRVQPHGNGSEALWRRAAAEMKRELEANQPRAAILLGSRVANLLGTAKQWPVFTRHVAHGRTYWYLANPAGRCFLYNDPENRRRAGEILLAVARERLSLARRAKA